MALNKIIPHLWYDTEAEEAADFYASVFPDSRVTSVTTLPDTPSGDCDVVSFEVLGQPMMAISAGPLFRFNPSVSFFVTCDTADELDAIWQKLGDGGEALMPLDKYPWSERYGWMNDRYGLSWQLMLADPAIERPRLMPCVMFVGDNYGRADDAIAFWTSVFDGSRRGRTERSEDGNVLFADFTLEDQWFIAMDSQPHDFAFDEAISFLVRCDDQAEIDRYWTALSAVPESEQCGWLKDKFGLSWQVSPAAVDTMLRDGTPEQVARVTQAFLQMKKFDVAMLERAYRG
jgi:predicted 3-demethylubiquinone-9 3-methyltransferase (glyoxalase superfamily)